MWTLMLVVARATIRCYLISSTVEDCRRDNGTLGMSERSGAKYGVCVARWPAVARGVSGSVAPCGTRGSTETPGQQLK